MPRRAAATGEAVRCEYLADREGRGRRGIHDPDVPAGDLLDLFAQERIVRAAEEQCVDHGSHDAALREERLDVFTHGRFGIRSPGLAGLHERDELRAGLLGHVDERIKIAQRAQVRARSHREGGREDPDGAPRGRGQRGRGARPHHADHRHARFVAHGLERDGCCGVAGDDDELAITSREPSHRLACELQDLPRLARAVRHARLVAEVDRRLLGQLTAKLSENGETADARVEQADRPVRRPSHPG